MRRGLAARIRQRPGSALPGLGVVCLLLLLVPGCAYFNTFYHAKKFYAEAERIREAEIRRSGQAGGSASAIYKKAIDRCERVIENYPGSKWQDDAYLLLAKSHYGRGDYLAAETAATTLVESFPESGLRADAIFWKGKILFAKEDFVEARTTWQALLEEFPRYEEREEVAYLVAESLREDGEIEPAVAAYENYLSQFPKGEHAEVARLELGNLLIEERRYDDAEQTFRLVAERGKEEIDRIEGQIRLGEVIEIQGRYDEALELYARLEVVLDPEVMKGRMTREERADFEASQRAAREAARADSLQKLAFQNIVDQGQNPDQTDAERALQEAAGLNPQSLPTATGGRGLLPGFRRDPNDPRQRLLGRVMIHEANVLNKLDRSEDAILVYEQVVNEFPQSVFAAEAQYRLGYTYEVHLEQLDRAQSSYDAVARQGNSAFREDAQRRAKNLVTLRGLMASASKDSVSQAAEAAAEARFMRAELHLFQEDDPRRAIEEYESIERDFQGTEPGAKAGLALAWITQHSLGDSIRALEKYTEVAQAYPNTEYGRRASLVLYGPEPDPEPIDFAGPSVEELTAPENVALAEAALLAAEAKADSLRDAQAPAPIPGGVPPGAGPATPAGTLAESGRPGSPSGEPASTPAAAGAVSAPASLGEMVKAGRRGDGENPPDPEVAANPEGEGDAARAGTGTASVPGGPSIGAAAGAAAGAVAGAAAVPTQDSGLMSSPDTTAAPTAPPLEAAPAPAPAPAKVAAVVPTRRVDVDPSAPVTGPPASPTDSTLARPSVPAELYLDPLAVPGDGPSPVARTRGKAAPPPAPRQKPEASESKDDGAKDEGAKDEGSQEKSDSEKKNDDTQESPPDSTSGEDSR